MKNMKFRGKPLNDKILDGDWAIGNLIVDHHNKRAFINNKISNISKFNGDCMGSIISVIEVDIKTVGQLTGLKDKNGKKVFQGDILKVQSAKEDYGSCSYGGFLKVVALTCGYTLEPFNPTLKEIEDKGEFWDSSSLWHIRESKYIEVIGNIYENPNLLNQ